MKCAFCPNDVSGITSGFVMEVEDIAVCSPCLETLVLNEFYEQRAKASARELAVDPSVAVQ